MGLAEYYKKCESKLLTWSIASWALLTLFCNIIRNDLSDVITNCLVKLAANLSIKWLSSILNWFASNLIQEIIIWLFAWVTPTSIILALYHFIGEYINTKYWKKKYPQYDISGEWRDTTQYSKSLDNDGWKDVVNESISTVQIEQSCKTIKVKPSDGIGFTWQSILVDWDNDGNLNILYTVEYKDKLQRQGYPERRYGYERMHIDTTGLSMNQKPQRMVGKFWHCISFDGMPIHMGDVTYERKTPLKHQK